MHKFSDFADEDNKPLDGDKCTIKSILDKKIVVKGFKTRASRYKKDGCEEYAIIQFERLEEDEEKKEVKNFVFFTGSYVIIDALRKYEKELPFETVVKKIDKYYTFT